jgi:threonine dehydrogenase-like Zn-dependent dehydrogenase
MGCRNLRSPLSKGVPKHEYLQNGDNVAAVLLETNRLELRKIDMPPEPKENEVLVQINRVGICGSDVH